MDNLSDDVRKRNTKRLFCVVVGCGQPFHVDVNLGETMVSDLKDVIKASEGITVPEMAMRLFLAKSIRDGDWLNPADAEALTLDEDGELPQGFVKMDPTLPLNDPECFGEGFHAVEGQVHVLVVLLIDRATKRQKVVDHLSTKKDVAAILALVKELGNPNCLEAGKMLALPDTVLGTELQGGLYIRREYVELCRIIQNELASVKATRRVLVLGSPGIGKSVFGVFLLLLFMTQKKDVAFRALLTEVVYYFTWSDTDGYEVSIVPGAEKSYEGLFDGCERDGIFSDHFRHAYLFASPRTKNYNTFVKGRCFQVIMNPWTKEECRSFVDVMRAKAKDQESEAECQSPVAMEDEAKESKEESLSSVVGDDQDEWFQKFNLVGGKPRFLFSADSCDDLLNLVKEAIPLTLGELKKQVADYYYEVFDEWMKHILFVFRREERSQSRSYLTYSSLVVECMVGARYMIQSADKVRSLLRTPQSDLQSWRGKEIEKFLLQDLVTSPFCMRALEEGNAEAKSFSPLNAKTEIIQASSAIKNELVLHIPLTETFPAIDGVLVDPKTRHIIYVQSTVSRAYPVQYQCLKDAYEDLAGRGEFQGYSHILLFLVSNDIFDQFTAQPYYNADGKRRQTRPDITVKQYVGKISG